MAIPYGKAIKILQDVAEDGLRCNGRTELVPLLGAIGRVAAKDHISPLSTPPHDTSAMDGYAMSSAATSNASGEHPVIFVVKGIVTAGDEPIKLTNESENGLFPCVEVMTGARFPESTSGATFDACVKIEDTISLGTIPTCAEAKGCTYISVNKPLSPNANRRFAGGDIKRGDVVLPESTVVCSRHIMALASVGVAEILVRRKLQVAIWSTGNELSEGPDSLRSESHIFNSNGPFLVAALRELGVDAKYKGILKDDPTSLQAALSSVAPNAWDLMITTGAVSKGKFDFIVPALGELRADVHFHGVAVRPGHPVLFATTNYDTGQNPLFGLPGNPIATAACFRFLVVPFLRYLQGRECEQPETAQLLQPNQSFSPSILSSPHLDCFRHGTVYEDEHGTKTVVLSGNQSPAIISHFASSNCWVHIPRDRPSELEKATVYCYPHASSLE